MGEPFRGIVPALAQLFGLEGGQLSAEIAEALKRSGLTAADFGGVSAPRIPSTPKPFIPDPSAVATEMQAAELAPRLALHQADVEDRQAHRGHQEYELEKLQNLRDIYNEERGLPSREFQAKVAGIQEASKQASSVYGAGGTDDPWNIPGLGAAQAATIEEQKNAQRRMQEARRGQSRRGPGFQSTPADRLFFNLRQAGYDIPLHDERGALTDVAGLVEREVAGLDEEIEGRQRAEFGRGMVKKTQRIAVGALETTLNALADTEFDQTTAAYGEMLDAGHQPTDINPKTGKQYSMELPRGGVRLNFTDPEGNPDFPQILDFVQQTLPETDYEQYGGMAAEAMMWLVPFLPNKLRAPMEAAKWGKNVMPVLVNMIKRGTTEGLEASLKAAFAGYSDKDTEFIRNISIGFGLGTPLVGGAYRMAKQSGLNQRSALWGQRQVLRESEKWKALEQEDIRQYGAVQESTKQRIASEEAKLKVRSPGELATEMDVLTAEEAMILSGWNIEQIERTLQKIFKDPRAKIPLRSNVRQHVEAMLDAQLAPYYKKLGSGIDINTPPDEILGPFFKEAQRLRQALRDAVNLPGGRATTGTPVEAQLGLDLNRWLNRSRNFNKQVFESTAMEQDILAELSLNLRQELRSLAGTGAPQTYTQAVRRPYGSARRLDRHFQDMPREVKGRTLGEQVDELLAEEQSYQRLRSTAQGKIGEKLGTNWAREGLGFGEHMDKQMSTIIAGALTNRGFLAARSMLDVGTNVPPEKILRIVQGIGAVGDVGASVAKWSRFGRGPGRVRAPYRTVEQARAGVERPPMPGNVPMRRPFQVTGAPSTFGPGGSLLDRLRRPVQNFVPHSVIPSVGRAYLGAEDAPDPNAVSLGGVSAASGGEDDGWLDD
jgi:hypothetical protein